MTGTDRSVGQVVVAVAVGALVILVVVLTRLPGAATAGSSTPGASVASPGPSAEASVTGTPTTGGSATSTPTASEPPAEGSTPPWATGLSALPAVPLDQSAEFGTGVTATLDSVVQVSGVGRLPGEKSGPALAITVRLHDGSDAAIDLDYVVVDLYSQDGRVGSMLTQDPHSSPLSGALAAGQDATGTYVLLLPDPTSSQANITVSYVGSEPAVAFQGSVTP